MEPKVTIKTDQVVRFKKTFILGDRHMVFEEGKAHSLYRTLLLCPDGSLSVAEGRRTIGNIPKDYFVLYTRRVVTTEFWEEGSNVEAGNLSL